MFMLPCRAAVATTGTARVPGGGVDVLLVDGPCAIWGSSTEAVTASRQHTASQSHRRRLCRVRPPVPKGAGTRSISSTCTGWGAWFIVNTCTCVMHGMVRGQRLAASVPSLLRVSRVRCSRAGQEPCQPAPSARKRDNAPHKQGLQPAIGRPVFCSSSLEGRRAADMSTHAGKSACVDMGIVNTGRKLSGCTCRSSAATASTRRHCPCHWICLELSSSLTQCFPTLSIKRVSSRVRSPLSKA
jgi:hypothetical protein